MKGKRVGINSLFFIPSKVGGTEIFLRNQIEQLSKRDNKNIYYIFANNENAKVFNKLPNNFNVVLCPVNGSNRFLRIFWEQIGLPLQCLFYKLDLLHSPGYTTPILTHCKKITTIFDLNYHFFPEDFSKLQLIIYKILIPLGAKVSDKILVHSYKSESELSKVLKVDKEKIEVIYPGVSEDFAKKISETKIKSVLAKHKITKRFILSNAVSHPHKNLSSLIEAYVELFKKNKKIPDLVLLGFPGREQGKINKIIKREKLGKRIIFTGWVDSVDVPSFYKAAKIFVFPSLYEGFGLPLIESMASGTVLLTSKYSCIPEIVANGGVIIDTKKPKEIATNIEILLKNKELRKRIIKKGLLRAKDFSWNKFGLDLLLLYDDLVNVRY